MFSEIQLIFFIAVEVILLVVIYQALKSGVASKGAIFKFDKKHQPFSYWTSVTITIICFVVVALFLILDIVFGNSLREAKQICNEESNKG